MLTELNLNTIQHLLNGAVVEQFTRLLEECTTDIKRRKGVKKPRLINMQIALSPKVTSQVADEETGAVTVSLDGVSMVITMKNRLPDRSSIEFDCGLQGNSLVFNPDSPGNHRQKTLLGSVEAT